MEMCRDLRWISIGIFINDLDIYVDGLVCMFAVLLEFLMELKEGCHGICKVMLRFSCSFISFTCTDVQ